MNNVYKVVILLLLKCYFKTQEGFLGLFESDVWIFNGFDYFFLL